MRPYISRFDNESAVVPTPKPRASLAALQWAADRAGKSYGVFTQRMTAEDEKRIQEEYEAYKRERDVEAAVRRVPL